MSLDLVTHALCEIKPRTSTYWHGGSRRPLREDDSREVFLPPNEIIRAEGYPKPNREAKRRVMDTVQHRLAVPAADRCSPLQRSRRRPRASATPAPGRLPARSGRESPSLAPRVPIQSP